MRPPAWIGWSAAAFAASTAHLLIDLHLGLYGPVAAEMSLLEGLWVLARSLLLGWWLLLVPLALLDLPGAVRSLLVVTVVEVLLSDGLIAVVVAPPPSDAFPWQDLSHLAALVTGAVAARLLWRERGRDRAGGPVRGRTTILVTVALVVVAKALSVPLNLEAIAT